MYSDYKTEGCVVNVNSDSIAFDPYLQRLPLNGVQYLLIITARRETLS